MSPWYLLCVFHHCFPCSQNSSQKHHDMIPRDIRGEMTNYFLFLPILNLTKKTDQARYSSKTFSLTTMKSVMIHLQVFPSLDNIKEPFTWALLEHFTHGLLKLDFFFSLGQNKLWSGCAACKVECVMEFYTAVYSPVPVQLVCEEEGFSRVLLTGLSARTVVFWSWLDLWSLADLRALPGTNCESPFLKGLRSNLLQG